MAVTQQLARLTDAQIALCASDPKIIDGVCGWEELPPDDYADLDWAPSMLNRAAARAGLASDLVEALVLSTAGKRELHPGYEGPSAIYAPISCLSGTETASVATLLNKIVVPTLLSPAAVEAAAAGTGLAHPNEYLHEMFERLRDFYDGASLRGMGIVLWWD